MAASGHENFSSRLARATADSGGPFVGSCTYDLTPTADGSSVVLLENSEMKNPMFRLMSKLFGPTKYMDEHLEDIARHFGETAVVK